MSTYHRLLISSPTVAQIILWPYCNQRIWYQRITIVYYKIITLSQPLIDAWRIIILKPLIPSFHPSVSARSYIPLSISNSMFLSLTASLLVTAPPHSLPLSSSKQTCLYIKLSSWQSVWSACAIFFFLLSPCLAVCVVLFSCLVPCPSHWPCPSTYRPNGPGRAIQRPGVVRWRTARGRHQPHCHHRPTSLRQGMTTTRTREDQ